METSLSKRSAAIVLGAALIVAAAAGAVWAVKAYERPSGTPLPTHGSGVQTLATVAGAETRYCLQNDTTHYNTTKFQGYTDDISTLDPIYKNGTENTIGCPYPHYGMLITDYASNHHILSESVWDIYTVNTTTPFQGNYTLYVVGTPIFATVLPNETMWKVTHYGSSFHVYDCPNLVCTTNPKWIEPKYTPRPLVAAPAGINPCSITFTQGQYGWAVQICGSDLNNILYWISVGVGAIGEILWDFFTDGIAPGIGWAIFGLLQNYGYGFLNWFANTYCGGCIYIAGGSYSYTQCWWIYCWTTTEYYAWWVGCGSPPPGY